MKILVTVKSVPDPDQCFAVNALGTGLDDEASGFIVNPFDAIAVEEAVRVRESGKGIEEIVVVSISPPICRAKLKADRLALRTFSPSVSATNKIFIYIP